MAKQFKPETLCVQAGWTPKKGEPRVLPIYQSTTFKYDTSEQMARLFDLEDSGYFYTRLQNPTNDAVAAKIAALEGGVAAMLTSSGHVCQPRCARRGNLCRFPSEHQSPVRRNNLQPYAGSSRHRKVCPYRPQARRTFDCRQYFPHSYQLPPV